MSDVPTYFDDDGMEHALPWKWAICDRCRGNGTHGNPAFDGLSADDEFWHDDEDFLPDYLAGRYDVRCEAGCADGKMKVPDLERMTPEQIAARESYERDMWESYEISRQERMMGA